VLLDRLDPPNVPEYWSDSTSDEDFDVTNKVSVTLMTTTSVNVSLLTILFLLISQSMLKTNR